MMWRVRKLWYDTTAARRRSFRERIVSFTFDDFPESAYSEGGAILERLGWRGTYYTCGGVLGRTLGNLMVASRSVVEACAEHHEIACHSFGHLNCTTTPWAAVREDLDLNRTALPFLSDHFAYPFGASDFRSRARIGRLFRSCRGTEAGVNRVADLNDLRANAIYEHRGTDALFRMIDENDGWLIFYTHDVRQNPSEFGCTPATFEAVARRVAASGAVVKPVREVV